MAGIPERVAEFLSGRRFAVAGLWRDPRQPANAVCRKLRDCGYEVFPIIPNAPEVEGVRSYADAGSVPGPIDGLVVATHPRISVDVIRSCAGYGIPRVWFHRSFGRGSVSEEAPQECRARGIEPIVGGCPLMYCEPVDIVPRCRRWFLRWRGRVPG